MDLILFQMSINSYTERSSRSQSIQTAIGRDFERMKLFKKQEVKRENDLRNLDRRLSLFAKWNQRINNRMILKELANTGQNQQTMNLDEFMERERIKNEKILNSKKVANENIRRR